MEAFVVKCHIGRIDFGLIAQPLNRDMTKFKLEFMTEEQYPMYIHKENDSWVIDDQGDVPLGGDCFKDCCRELNKQVSAHKK